ncbi:GlcG/HbpS family heme-binding protein [Agrobacterium pusense]|uniref:GlcG/HbpS family heme-binding protein n=1 Tax=Agrobacterium pusense TaxID=648995 RepID=UPI0028973630|nr:heme-binding protein [Agrobacterium pusense]
MPRTIETLTRDDAGAMLALAEVEAARIGIPYCIAVVDAAAQLIAFVRQDGSQPGCVRLAIDKAWSAVTFQQPTDVLATFSQPGAELYGIQQGHDGRVVVFGGGIPVVRNGRIIGAIGTSAGTVAQDICVAEAALAAL